METPLRFRADGPEGRAQADMSAPISALTWLPAVPFSVFAGDARAALLGALRAADVFVVLLAAVVSHGVRYGSVEVSGNYWLQIVIACLIAANSFEFAHVYTIASLRRMPRHLCHVALAWSVTLLGVIAVIYFARMTSQFPRGWMLLWSVTGFLGFAVVRSVAWIWIANWRRNGKLVRNVAIVGEPGVAERLARRMESGSDTDTRVVGLFRPLSVGGKSADGPDIDDLMSLCRRVRVDEVAIALPCPTEFCSALRKLGVLPADVKLCPDVPGIGGYGIPSARAPEALLLERPLAGWRIVVKRSMDVVISAALLIFLAPLMLLIAALIKRDSPGPVLFGQLRFGFNKNPITVYKFRSMYVDEAMNPAVPQACRNDPRVTRLGRFLRHSSLDELPQLLNVLAGSMSLVGPRPHAIAHDEKYAAVVDHYLARHRVKPGITGWAQVNGLRGETDTIEKMEKRVEHDLFYIDQWSPLLDLWILFRTLQVGFNDRNAY